MDDPEKNFTHLSLKVTRRGKQIMTYKPVKKMFEGMHPEGYWEVISPSTKKAFGKGVEYRQNSTHFILSYLAELGMTREDPKI